MTLHDELRKLHGKNREEISKVIESVLKEHSISFDNPDYYRRVLITDFNNGKKWLIDGKPVFWESNPIMNHDHENNKITMTVQYSKL